MQTKLIEAKRVFDLGDHERVELAIQSALEAGDDCEAMMAAAIDRMEATAKRKYGRAILQKAKAEP